MAWVRYEDQFYSNAKATAAVAEDPGALALHLLANAWTNTQRHPGYVPVHQPAILLCDRGLAQKWADLLVRVGLWERLGELCAECVEEYAHLPESTGPGYVFHNASQYRAPAREKQTPGTPAELSAKRQAAGRKGGQTSAARRTGGKQTVRANDEANQANGQANEAKSDTAAPSVAEPSESATVVDEEPNANPDTTGQIKQVVRANQANGASKRSKRASNSASPEPDPVRELASNEASRQETLEQRVNRLAAVYTDAVPLSSFVAVRGVVKIAASKGVSDRAITHGLKQLADEGRSVTADSLRYAIYGKPATQSSGRAGTGPYINPDEAGAYDSWKTGPKP